MSIFIVLMIFSLIIFVMFFVGLIWSILSDQNEDLQTPAERILFEDTPSE